ncbi:hypothetical protein PILCRDRAFT_88492 [Piloderma croceum F 1598]|uniref:Uncharacterized protein n=1 Tax=Piloderma croceum (strain F 1598) TaxID=765440 RepID=A0A0C3B9C3_PILCF|nr:hypothetical protein PILCRDRAFT_88492 [Piloderma croceum F 1598]
MSNGVTVGQEDERQLAPLEVFAAGDTTPSLVRVEWTQEDRYTERDPRALFCDRRRIIARFVIPRANCQILLSRPAARNGLRRDAISPAKILGPFNPLLTYQTVARGDECMAYCVSDGWKSSSLDIGNTANVWLSRPLWRRICLPPLRLLSFE